MSTASIHKKILVLQKQMEDAAAAMDFELAARLRNEIAVLRGETIPDARPDEVETVTVSQPPPGAMGLGTHMGVAEPPKDWKRPKKPDPMTANVKRRGS